MSHTHETTTPIRLRYLPDAKITPGKRRRVYERDDWTCQYCGRRIDPTTPNQANGRNAPVQSARPPVFLEVDHIVPRVLGGDNSLENLRAACSPCNRKKRDSTQDTDWGLRAALAVEILTTRTVDQARVLSAVRALLGVSVSIDGEGKVTLQ